MKEITQGVQTVALVVLGIAAVPLTMNQCAEMDARKRQTARAEQQAVLGAAALEAGDPALAAAAYAQAVNHAPLANDLRDGLLRAHVEQILADAQGINAGNAVQLQAELAGAMLETSDPDARMLLAYGRVLQFRGRSDDARAQFKQAVAKAPDLALGHLLLGDALLKAGEYEAAASALSRSLELDPAEALAEFALGQVRVQQEKWEEAARLLENASRSVRSPQLYTSLGKAEAAREKWDKAQAALEKAIALDPNQTPAYELLGDAYLQNSRVEPALKAYQASWERGRSIEALRKLARLHQRLQQWERAGELFGQLRVLEPSDPEPHCGIGTSADNTGQTDLAIAAYNRCAQLAAKSAEHAEMGQKAQLRAGALQRALDEAKDKKGDDKKAPPKPR